MKMPDEKGTCFCDQYLERPKSFDDMMKRYSQAFVSSLKPLLTAVKTAPGGWQTLYQCKTCGRYWADDYPFGELQGGGLPVFCVLDGNDPERQWEKEIGWAQQLRRAHDDGLFLASLGAEIGPENCRQLNCQHKRIASSVKCKTHHFEMVKKRKFPE